MHDSRAAGGQAQGGPVKVDSFGFVTFDLADMQRLQLMDLVACGQHDGWDLSCYSCALRYETAEKLAERIESRLRQRKQRIPATFKKRAKLKEGQ